MNNCNNYTLITILFIVCTFMATPCFADPTYDLEQCEIKKGDTACVKNAIARGADVNAYGTESGNTALMRAAMFGKPQIAKLLLENGARHDLLSKNTSAINQWGALEIAAWYGSFDVIKEIIKAGGKPGGTSPITTPLRVAINSGYYDIVRWLIEQGADPAATNDEGANAMDSLLSQRSEKQRRNESLLILFFEKGVYPRSNNVKWSGSQQGSFLCHAISEQLFELAEKLIQKDLNINDSCTYITPSKDRFESSPLQLAVENLKQNPDKYTKLSLSLINHGANVNASSFYNNENRQHTALDDSLLFTNKAITVSLLSKGAKIGDGSTINAVRNVARTAKWTDVTNALNKVSDESQIPSQLSAISTVSIASSSDKGTSSTAKVKSPVSDQISFELAKAIIVMDDISEYLSHISDVNYVIDPNIVGFDDKKLGGMNPLGLALMSGREKMANQLLAKGANPKTEQTCVVAEIKSPYGITADTVTPIFPSDVSFKNRVIKCSSILVAVNKRLNSVVSELLARGVDVNSDYFAFGSLLNYALFDGNIELTKLLLKRGASVSKKANFGKDALRGITSFQLAISFGDNAQSDEMAMELLNKGSDFGAHLDGRPALHYAIDKDNQQMLLKLLSKKANPNSADMRGKTPLVYAAEKHRQTMIASLRKAGAKEPKSYDKAMDAAKRWSFEEADYWLEIGKTLHFNEKLSSKIAQVIGNEKQKQAAQLAEKTKFSKAENFCYSIKDEYSQWECLSGVESAKGNFSKAENFCYSIKDEYSQWGCLSGVEADKGNIGKAENFCYSIKDRESQLGCLSGVESAKGNLSKAENFCYSIKDEYSQWECLSGVEIAKVMMSQ